MPSSRGSTRSNGSKDSFSISNKNDSKNFFADRIKSLCTSFKDWTSLDALKHRGAVLLINGHLFQAETLTELTYCSNCCTLIYGLKGQKCKLCNAMCHQRCLKSTSYNCRKKKIPDSGIETNKPNHEHRFEKTTFLHPTYCDHCGVMIMGFYKQGLECKAGCKMKAHDDCKDLIGMPCSLEARPTKSIFSGSFKSMIGRINPMVNVDCQDRVRNAPVSVEDFQIERLLGEGSSGKVYLATYTGGINRLDTSKRNKTMTSGEQFAIKVVKKTTILVSSKPQSALTERKALNLGHKCPFLAKCHCCFHSTGRLFFVMDYVAGRDLVYHIVSSSAKKFTEHQARFYGAEIVLALRYLHSNHIIHRDLKLDNIILDRNGHCKLIDFGLSRDLLESGSTKTGTFCGTSEYIAPEIIKQEPYDYSVDWWSFGVVMFEMLLGYSPFQCEDDEQLYQMIANKRVEFPRWANLSYESKSLIEGLLTKDPRDRLGCQPLEGLSKALLEHNFFMFEPCESGSLQKSFQWEGIQNLIIPPPVMSALNPDISANENLGTANSGSTLSPIDATELENISQSDFNNFSYCCSSFMSITNEIVK